MGPWDRVTKLQPLVRQPKMMPTRPKQDSSPFPPCWLESPRWQAAEPPAQGVLKDWEAEPADITHKPEASVGTIVYSGLFLTEIIMVTLIGLKHLPAKSHSTTEIQLRLEYRDAHKPSNKLLKIESDAVIHGPSR